MSNILYKKMYKLVDLYKENDGNYGTDAWTEVVALTNAAIANKSYLRLSDNKGVIASAVYNKHDGDFTLIILDDCGHTNIVSSAEDIEKIGYEGSESLHIVIETNIAERVEKILSKYSTGSYSFDYMGMALRLAELGEGQ